MLLIGFKNVTSSTGNTEDHLGHVTHQRVDVIASSPSDTTETLSQLYHAMVKKANGSLKELQKLRGEIEYSDMPLEKYEEIEGRLLGEIQILGYDRVIVVEGLVLK